MDNLKPVGWTWISFPDEPFAHKVLSEESLEEILEARIMGGKNVSAKVRQEIKRAVEQGEITTPEPLYTQSQLYAAVAAERKSYIGMNLRDWFAGMALIGLLAGGDYSHKDAAAESFNYADAMIKEGEIDK